MSCSHAYPPDLARYVVEHWPEATPSNVSTALLDDALSASFQASLTSEENRPTRFRLLLTPAERLPASGAPNDGVLRLLFERSRPLHADELRCLAPAVPFETALIGAHAEEGALRIWGIAHSGPAWLAPTWGGRSLVPNWSHDPIIHVTGPGQLAVRCAGKLVGAIERGVLVDAMMDVFESEWLLGVGTEVSAELPAPLRVWRALDTEARERRPDDIESVGTRHRAAYRFVNDHPGGLAIVVSHDGGVTFVANRDKEIVFWEQTVRP